jgi:very-short-patch-repair endonuclease
VTLTQPFPQAGEGGRAKRGRMRVFQEEAMMRMRSDIPVSAKSRARAMRAEPTEAERKLWHALRDRRMQALKFRWQAPVGPYIVDFLCIAHRLVVEADGSQHAESRRDAIRDKWLAREGYTILRFSNRDVLTARESVLATIAATCGLPW